MIHAIRHTPHNSTISDTPHAIPPLHFTPPSVHLAHVGVKWTTKTLLEKPPKKPTCDANMLIRELCALQLDRLLFVCQIIEIRLPEFFKQKEVQIVSPYVTQDPKKNYLSIGEGIFSQFGTRIHLTQPLVFV